MSIHSKLYEIQRSITGLEKNGIGPSTQGGYRFLAVDDVLKAVRPLLNEHKVIVAPALLDHGFEYTKALPKEDSRVPKVATSVWVKYRFDFIDVEDGSTLSATVIGEGADTSDKAIRKATTSAWKIALIQTFSLVTGEEDPDAADGANVSDGHEAKASAAQAKIDRARPADPAAEWRGKLELLAKTQARDFGDILALGDRKADGKPRAEWTKSAAFLEGLYKAVEAGEA